MIFNVWLRWRAATSGFCSGQFFAESILLFGGVQSYIDASGGSARITDDEALVMLCESLKERFS